MFHLLSDFFPKEEEKSPVIEKEIGKKMTPKSVIRKRRFNYQKKNWRKDIIYIEILILILLIFFPIIFYVTGKMEFNF